MACHWTAPPYSWCMNPSIEASPPATWQDLEAKVGQILGECGYLVEIQKNVQLAGRGDVNIDVWADEQTSPPNVIAVECKNWAKPANKHEVHAFRMVVGESGANTGLLVSAAGFQSGAVDAASYSNVRLLNWNEFQEMFIMRWFRNHFAPTLAEETDPLHEYTEPINARITRKESALPKDRQKRVVELVHRHLPLAISNFAFHPVVLDNKLSSVAEAIPALPLRSHMEALEGSVPDEVLDATALRTLLDALIRHSHAAIAEFDAVFGERG